MIREFRYIVHKLKDTQAALTTAERDELDRIGMKIEAWRKTVGKRPMRCVVVESDWPEYEPTWAAIEQRMTGRALPSLAELERDAGRYRNLRAMFTAEESVGGVITVGLGETFSVPAKDCGEWPSAVDVALDQQASR